MQHFIKALVLALFVIFISPQISYTQNQGRELKKEEKIWKELEEKSPKVVEQFKLATENLDKGNYEETIKLYNEVLEEVPNFEHALRRIGYALVAVDRRAEGLEMSKKALDLNRSSENLIGYASILADIGNNKYQPPESTLEEALQLTKEAIKKDTEKTPEALFMFVQLSLELNRPDDFENAVNSLLEKYPNEAGTHYYNAIRLANYGEFTEAEAEIIEAEKLGTPREATQPILTAIEDAKSQQYFGMGNYIFYGIFIIGAWILGLATLFIVGKILSLKTLKSIENSDPNDITGKAQIGLKGVYRKIITIAGIYYYLSQPILILLTIALTIGITVFFLYVGTIPIKLLLIIGFVALASVFYMIKSLVIRAKAEEPGRILKEEEAPELWSLVRNVAEVVNTRPVDEIRITPGADLAVYERGSIRTKMQDKAERVLILGLAVIDDFNQNAFRAVLAHEYGHFSNRDTAGGDIAFQVNNDIIKFAESMALSGTATFYNISFQFLRFYHFLFRRITHGASRLQEILADRMAVYQFGKEAFREGLNHVIRSDVEFGLLANKEINAALAANRAMQNFYELKIEDEMTKNDVEQEFSKYLARPTTEDDTHPSPQDRYRLIEKINSKETPPLEGQVWDMFLNKETLIKEMNSMLISNIQYDY